MEKAFDLAEGLKDAFDKVANNQPFEKHDKEIRKVLKWMFLPDSAEVKADTDFSRVKSMSSDPTMCVVHLTDYRQIKGYSRASSP